MGTMTREIKNLRGKRAAKRVQDAQDAIRESEQNAFRYQETENTTAGYLQQLYFGIDQLIQIAIRQDEEIKNLVEQVAMITDKGRAPVPVAATILEPVTYTKPELTTYAPSPVTAVRKKGAQKNVLTLAKAFSLIEKYRSSQGRILWSQAPKPKKLVFAYLQKAELEKLDIESTMVMQSIPEYRRVFQYVVYHIGPWREIVEEYKSEREDLKKQEAV
jgi:hypothetical protein